MENPRDVRAFNRTDAHRQSPKTPHLTVAAFLSWRDNNPVTLWSIRRPRSRGFTLLEAAVTLGIFALIFTGAVSLLTQPLEFDRENETVDILKALKRAVIGDPDVVSEEVRTDFGFIGPMGNLPPALSDLWLLGAQPTFTIDTSLKLGTGWTGPYIEPPALSETDALGLDAWGNMIVLDAVAGVSAATGQDYVARLISPGSDADTGTSDDLTVEIYETDTIATVAGYVRDSGANPLSGVPVRLRHPVAGIPGQTSGETDGNGAFQVTDIPFGNRSLEVDPHLLYQPDTAITSPGTDDVQFFIQNFSPNNVMFNSLTAEFSPTAYYTRVVIGTTTVYNNPGNRKGSGDVVNFANFTVTGAGSTALTTRPVRIQSAFTQVPDSQFGAAQAGGTRRIRLINFRTTQSGAGSPVNMSGVTFKVTFSDGSVAIFTTDN